MSFFFGQLEYLGHHLLAHDAVALLVGYVAAGIEHGDVRTLARTLLEDVLALHVICNRHRGEVFGFLCVSEGHDALVELVTVDKAVGDVLLDIFGGGQRHQV